jgi:uncharacterized phiE125 gp8 family phage protein
MKTRLVAGPAVEPITLADAKVHLRLDITDDDAYVSSLIAMARRTIERGLGLSLISQTWDLVLDSWPSSLVQRPWGFAQSLNAPPSPRQAIRIPNPPLISVTSITYDDPNGTLQTLASNQYRVLVGTPGLIVPASGLSWPAIRSELEAITVRYLVGFGADATLVPETLKHAIRLLVGTAYETREETITGTTVSKVPYIERLLASEDPGQYW